MMISFILVGKNVEKTISLCISSVERFIINNDLHEYEVLYIDSDSRDDTVYLASLYPINIYQIKGNVNAAIGRNTGAEHSKGDILFFLDADMEILPGLDKSLFLDSSNRLSYPFTRGFHRHIHYDSNFKYLYTREEVLPLVPVWSNVTGGLMIIDRSIWFALGGMDERLIRNQDVDFGLRMAKAGYPALVHNCYFVNHHTISYYDDSRLRGFLMTPALFSPGILLRKHLFNPMYLKHYYKSLSYTVFFFIIALLTMFNPTSGLILLIVYVAIHLVRAIRQRDQHQSLIRVLVYKALYPVYTLLGFIGYYPDKPKYSANRVN